MNYFRLIDGNLLTRLIGAIYNQENRTPHLQEVYAEVLESQDPKLIIQLEKESYEIAKIFNTPTHQVLMMKAFEEERVLSDGFDPDGEEDWGEDGPANLEVSYSTTYQITQIMFHNGVRIARSFGYDEEATRDAYWAKLSQENAQRFVDATVQFIEANTDESSSK